LAENLKDFDKLQIPLPVPDYTTKKILTMDYVRGTKITELSPLARLDLDGVPLAEELFRAYLKQVLVDGFFHADPHPGNIFLTNDGRVALLDLGMIGRTTREMQEHLLKIVLAMSEGNSEETADVIVRISETTDDFDPMPFRRRIGVLVAEQCDNSLKDMDLGRALLGAVRAAAETGLFVPPELTLLGKTLFQLHQIGEALDPNFDPNASIRRHASEILNERLRKNVTPGNFFGSLLDLKEFIGHLPPRLNKILDAVANAEVEVNVKSADIDQFMEGFQKIANRIATGLVLAALIIGAALLIQVETSFRILGYPGFAMLCFMAAGAGGFWLVLTSLIGDRRRKQRR
jgi:predicted unusual protein kinase regulating ubiquinone biosynthesis (AarF/ABC1/UbiB family)